MSGTSNSWREKTTLEFVSTSWSFYNLHSKEYYGIFRKAVELQRPSFLTSIIIGWSWSIQSPMILGRNVLNEEAGSWTNSWRILRNLLMTREPAVPSCSSVSASCCRVKEWSSCCTICSVTAGPICTFRLSKSVNRKPRIESVVAIKKAKTTNLLTGSDR